MKRVFSVTLIGALLWSLLTPATALAYQVTPPPATLQNGSFESNPYSTNTTQTSRNINQTDLLGWLTNNTTGTIELWRSGFKPATGTTAFNAAPGAGNWFCELNATEGPNSYIYQDVATIPGALYQWSFLHRGRNGQDTAMMLLGPAGPLTYAANAQPAFGGTQIPDSGVVDRGPTYLVARMTDWWRHLGYYKTGPSQTATRFELYSYSIVPSGPSAAAQAEGNLVDDATWTLIAAPLTVTRVSGSTIDPNILGQVNTTNGFHGEFQGTPDFITPGTKQVTINVYDSNNILVGNVVSTVNIYVILTAQFVNEAGTPIATPIYAYFPANYANNNPADFAAGAFTYNITGSAPVLITDPNTGIVYLYRGLSHSGDPTGLSAPELGTLSGNATVTYVYVPVVQALTVILVDTSGNDITSLYTTPPIQTALDNGSPYRVTAIGSVSDLDYPLSFSAGGNTYYFKEIASMPGSDLQVGSDPPTGIMDSDKTVKVVYALTETTYTVSGVVTGLESEFGNNGGVVINYTIDGSADSTTTLSDGSYSIADIPAGTEVVIQAPDDVPGLSTTYRSAPIAGYDIPNLSQNEVNKNFTYYPTYTVSGTVSGVLPPDVLPTEISATITGPYGTDLSGTWPLDANGYYEIPLVPAGSTVVIPAPPDIPASGGGTYVAAPTSGYEIVNIQADWPNQDFEYTLTYTVSGTVRGIPDLLGRVISFSIDGASGTVSTDATGYYSIPFVPVGSHLVIDPLPNVTIGSTSYLAAPILGYDLTAVSSDIPDNNFVYLATHTVSGTVSGLSNNSGIIISYVWTTPVSLVNIVGTVETDANGFYKIENIPNQAEIVITAPANKGLYTASPVTGYDLKAVTTDIPDNNFLYMRALYTVSGNVSGLSDNSGITINYSIDGIPGSTVTDVNGDYRITNTPVGAIVVIRAPVPVGPIGYTAAPVTGYAISISGDSLHNDFVFSKTETTTPGTGDTTNLALPIGLVLAGFISIAASVLLKRKSRI